MKAAGNHRLLILIVAGAFAGGVVGWQNSALALKFAFLGEFFLNALRMIVVPLIMASMISSITGLGDIRKLGRFGIKTLIYFLLTTAVAVAIGLVLVNVIQPGRSSVFVTGFVTSPPGGHQDEHPLVQMLLMLVPPNLFLAMSEMQILPLIVFSILFGAVLTTLGPRARTVSEFFYVINEVMIKMVQIILLAAPVGVFGLVAGRLGQSGGSAFQEELARLGKYCITVIIGLGVHGFIVLPLVLIMFTRRNPLHFFSGMGEALMTAFSTASSSATLPVTLRCVETRNNVPPRSAGFVCSLGATINMDGTALYEAVAAIFIAQAHGIELALPAQMIIFFTATLAAIGAAGIPEAGLVTMVMVLQAVHLPLEGIGGLLAVDWLLDRFRTTINVWGDSIGAAVLARSAEITAAEIDS